MSGEGVTTPTLAPFAVNGRRIGPGHPVYVIAEISSNHGQRFEAAVELVHGAHAAGADAVKLQTYTPDTITCWYHGFTYSLLDGKLVDILTEPGSKMIGKIGIKTYPVTVAIVWHATWQSSNGESGDLGILTTTSVTRDLPVAEIQAVVTQG